MQVIAIRYASYNRTLYGRKKAFWGSYSEARGVVRWQREERWFGRRVGSAGRRARIRECHRNRGLAAESDHPVLQRGRDRPRNPTSLATVSNQPVVKRAVMVEVRGGQFGNRVESAGRQTDAGEPTDQMPDRTSEPDDKTSVFLFQRPRTGFPVRLWISTGVNSRSNSGTVRFSSHSICYSIGNILGGREGRKALKGTKRDCAVTAQSHQLVTQDVHARLSGGRVICAVCRCQEPKPPRESRRQPCRSCQARCS